MPPKNRAIFSQKKSFDRFQTYFPGVSQQSCQAFGLVEQFSSEPVLRTAHGIFTTVASESMPWRSEWRSGRDAHTDQVNRIQRVR
jgi:hypothetical protein